MRRLGDESPGSQRSPIRKRRRARHWSLAIEAVVLFFRSRCLFVLGTGFQKCKETRAQYRHFAQFRGDVRIGSLLRPEQVVRGVGTPLACDSYWAAMARTANALLCGVFARKMVVVSSRKPRIGTLLTRKIVLPMACPSDLGKVKRSHASAALMSG